MKTPKRIKLKPKIMKKMKRKLRKKSIIESLFKELDLKHTIFVEIVHFHIRNTWIPIVAIL